MIRIIPKRRAAVTADDVIVFGPRQFSIISALVGACGQAITRDDLIAIVWDDGFLPADPIQTLRANIHCMRHAVSDLGGTIEFVAGCGYMLRQEAVPA